LDCAGGSLDFASPRSRTSNSEAAGLETTRKIPAWAASSSRRGELYMVYMRIVALCGKPEITRATARPSPSGKEKSRITTSGSSSLVLSTASRQSAASPQTANDRSALRRKSRRDFRTISLSSTTRIRIAADGLAGAGPIRHNLTRRAMPGEYSDQGSS
jgi:hypothetical protein